MKKPQSAAVLLVLALSLMTQSVLAADPMIFEGSNESGHVWVSTELARQRVGEAYVPLLIVIENRAGRPITVDRGSLSIRNELGDQEDLATLKEIRSDYGKSGFDLSMGRFFGIPIGTRLSADRVIPSNFFPALGRGSAVKLDVVVLPNLGWMIDLMYFRRPEGLESGREGVVEVSPSGWEKPVEVPFLIGSGK